MLRRTLSKLTRAAAWSPPDSQDYRVPINRHGQTRSQIESFCKNIVKCRTASFPPMWYDMVYRAVFTLNNTSGNCGFQFSSSAVTTARCSWICFVSAIYWVVPLLWFSGYKLESLWTKVREKLPKASGERGFVITSAIWSLVWISLNFIVPLTTCCCK